MQLIKFSFATIIAVIVFMIIIPYMLITLNAYLNLPVYINIFSHVIGGLFILIGIGIFFYTSNTFVIFGKGTPLITEPTTKFVEKGLYRYTRNPMYLGHFLIFLGEFLFFGSFLLLIYFFLQGIVLHLFVTSYEEPQLRKRYGKEYIDYTKRVKRWLII